MTKSLLFIIVILAGSLALSVKSCRDIRQDRNRLSDNQRTLLTDIESYRTRDSLSAASVERLTLSNREFRRYCSDLEKQVEDLGLKVKRLKSVSQAATETKYIVQTIIRDSVLPGRVDTIKCIDFRNDYLTLAGCVEGHQFSGTIESRDTLIQVVHRVPRRFWFIRWGTKGIRQEVVCKNPYSRIVYTEYIEMKR